MCLCVSVTVATPPLPPPLFPQRLNVKALLGSAHSVSLHKHMSSGARRARRAPPEAGRQSSALLFTATHPSECKLVLGCSRSTVRVKKKKRKTSLKTQRLKGFKKAESWTSVVPPPAFALAVAANVRNPQNPSRPAPPHPPPPIAPKFVSLLGG